MTADYKRQKKHYPKSILNPKQTTLYLFFTYERGQRVKARTTIKVLPEQWDFYKGKYKTSLKGSLELNNELDTIANGLLKQYSKLKDERDFLDEAEIRNLLESQLNGNIPVKRDSLARAKAEFETTKQQVLTTGTLKEYRTVFKSLDDLVIVKNELQNTTPSSGNPLSIDKLTDQICDDLQGKLDSILENTESKIMGLADKYETGNIQLTNVAMKDKLITLFLCLKSLTGKSTRRNKAGDPLFTAMDLNNIAQILRLHFAPYKGRKIDSIERRIYDVNSSLKLDDPAYFELSKALQKFFFQ